MFKFLQSKKKRDEQALADGNKLMAGIIAKTQQGSPAKAAASQAAVYAGLVIKHSLYHAIMQNTFIGSLDEDADFVAKTLQDGSIFVSNAKEGVSAIQRRTSTELIFDNLPVAYLAMVASPAAIEFNLRQNPDWKETEIDEHGKIAAFAAKIQLDQPKFTATVNFTAKDLATQGVSSKDIPRGSVMTIDINVTPK